MPEPSSTGSSVGTAVSNPIISRAPAGKPASDSAALSGESRRTGCPQLVTEDFAHSGEQQAQIIVHLGRRADGGAIRAAGVLVRHGDGRRNAVDPLGLRLIELLEKLRV